MQYRCLHVLDSIICAVLGWESKSKTILNVEVCQDGLPNISNILPSDFCSKVERYCQIDVSWRLLVK